MMRMVELLPQDWEIDLEDLANVFAREHIQSCNACVSTSMALCVWPCNCYRPNDKFEPDLMWNLDLYSRFDLADAWAFIAPVNWYGPTSNMKLLFDRLVCMNGGNPCEELIEHKNPELAMHLEHSDQWKELSINHLEGRTAAFFSYGDGGGDELDTEGKPKILEHKEYFDPQDEPFKQMRDAYAPLVWQCRYGGVEVPDQLWKYIEFGKDKKYSDNQAEHMVQEPAVIEQFEQWVADFAAFVAEKGKVKPGKYRAFGLKRSIDWRLEAKLGLRDVRLRLGFPPEGSSPQRQQELGLNNDDTLFPQQSERKRYYRKLHIERKLKQEDR